MVLLLQNFNISQSLKQIMEKMAQKLQVALMKKRPQKLFFSWNITVVIYIVWWDMALRALLLLHYYWPPTNCKLKVFCPPPQEKFDF